MKKVTKKFEYKPENGLNPYIGFMSFQHFSGEKLYSDIVVRPEANRTETERVECYPPSPDAEENGREEGYYPDSMLAYIRILWKEFEPRCGEYNYDFIEKIIEEAKSHSQNIIFRLMAHSTRKEDDVPEWLKSLIPCPERPDGMRVKDSPTDPLFLELFLKAVRALGERFDSSPEFYAIDISLPGAWGEGYKLENYPDDVLETIVDTYTDVFKNTKLLTQLARPNLIKYAKDTKNVNLGWRGDGLGDPDHIYNFYPKNIEVIRDNWKSAPVSFESYWWLSEWQRQGWNIDEIIEKTLSWHITSFNGKSMPAPDAWREKLDYWVSKMGYHFTPKSLAYPEKAKSGEIFEAELVIENVGVAPVYSDAKISLILTSQTGEDSLEIVSDTDVKKLLPAEHTVSFKAHIPETLKKGDHTMSLKMQYTDGKNIFLATNAKENADGSYELATITVI